MPNPPLDILGRRFGSLIAVKKILGRPKNYWLFKCDCGGEHITRAVYANSGDATRCRGCFKTHLSRRNTRHGMSHTTEYVIWGGIRQRCTNPKARAYMRYGGRGISVCDRWDKFENFYEDMGARPGPGYSIERRDNDGDYEPTNCYWATRIEQGRNTRSNRFLDFRGKRKTLADWSRETGIGITTISERLRVGWGVHDALTLRPDSTRRIKS